MTTRGQARVLIVDDEPANVALLRSLLPKAGYTDVVSTTDSRQVESIVLSFEPDLILLDLHMPHLTGFELLRQIEGMIRGPVPVPVLVLTADLTDAAKDEALRLGARDFVGKPFRLAELVMRIGNLVDTRLAELDLARQVSVMRTQLDARPNEQREHDELRERHRRIESAMADRQYAVVMQPIVDVAMGTLAGFEALARFPVPPITGPEVWFRQAHEVGLGVHLELAVLRLALSELTRLNSPMFLSVNVTDATLRSALLTEVLESHDRNRVVLELTENVMTSDFDTLSKVVQAVRAGGIRIAVDDAGTGFTGFARLLTLSPDQIKLDRAIVAGLDHDPARRVLAAALVSFAADVGAKLVAAGVETRAEFDAVREIGFHYAQGHFVGRPMPLYQEPISLEHL